MHDDAEERPAAGSRSSTGMPAVHVPAASGVDVLILATADVAVGKNNRRGGRTGSRSSCFLNCPTGKFSCGIFRANALDSTHSIHWKDLAQVGAQHVT